MEDHWSEACEKPQQPSHGGWGLDAIRSVWPGITHLLDRVGPQPKPLGNHLVDLSLAIFLAHTLIAGQAWLVPGRELVAAGGSHAEQLIALETPEEIERSHC